MISFVRVILRTAKRCVTFGCCFSYDDRLYFAFSFIPLWCARIYFSIHIIVTTFTKTSLEHISTQNNRYCMKRKGIDTIAVLPCTFVVCSRSCDTQQYMMRTCNQVTSLELPHRHSNQNAILVCVCITTHTHAQYMLPCALTFVHSTYVRCTCVVELDDIEYNNRVEIVFFFCRAHTVLSNQFGDY